MDRCIIVSAPGGKIRLDISEDKAAVKITAVYIREDGSESSKKLSFNKEG